MGVFPRCRVREEMMPFVTASVPALPDPPTPASGPLYVVTGRVASRRPFAKCMLFFDLVDAGTQSGDRGDQVVRLECLLHGGGLAGLAKADVKIRMHDVHLGDVLQVEGFLDAHHEFLVLEARSFTVLESWKATHRHREAFILEWPLQTNEEAALSKAAEVEAMAQEGHADDGVNDENAPLLLDNVCKYWVCTQGRCYQSVGGCAKFHPPLQQLPRYYTAYMAKRKMEKAVASQLEGDTHDPHDKTNKAFRAVLFADWLVETYGKARLAAGSGVVDVAGGRGDVSCRLWGHHGIPCTIVDPRHTKLRKKQQRVVLQQRGGLEGIKRVRCVMPTSFGNAQEGEEAEEAKCLRETLRDCSLVVGMHPDQATDVCFDAALAFGKPVACVPCCVFARAFPHRRRPGTADQEVESYEHLVEYLMAKPVPWPGAGTQKHFLPFLGRNQVLYTTPPGVGGEEGGDTSHSV